MLWTQLALVLASLGVAAAAMGNRHFSVMASVSVVVLLALLVLGVIMGLVTLKRGKSFVLAGIVLLAPAVWLLATSIPSGFSDAVGSRVLVSGYYSLNEYDAAMRELDSMVASMNWFGGLNMAAAALAAVTALLLFRHNRTRPVRPSEAPPE
nr:hypothetical protein [Kibdelosporangium sp. MJ126-NF4]